jgi:hypothetical protein
MKTEALYQAVLTAFTNERASSDDDAAAARALTDILVAFAALIAPPAFETVAVELAADDTLKTILGELQGLRTDFALAATTGVMVRSCV